MTPETRYYQASLPADTLRIGNSLHWVLDIAFREDDSRVRSARTAENLALLRRLALTRLTHESTTKSGIKAKCLMCGWDEMFLAKVLTPLRCDRPVPHHRYPVTNLMRPIPMKSLRAR